jgi:uncharacterized Zn finger protein (UPF0148 family)
VQPIMRQHGWSVPVLAEFLPRNPNLLGLNHNKGQKIQVRLRQSRDSGLMPYDSALGTALHELVHCDIGAHSAEFYKKLDELRSECDALEAKGVGGSGSGFDADGQKLSGVSHNPMTVRDGRLAAAAAAERRAQKRSLGMGSGGGQRLGGRRPAAGLPPAQMAALAATRRSADEQWCSSHLRGLEEIPDWLGPTPADSAAARGAAAAKSSPDTGTVVTGRTGSAPQAGSVYKGAQSKRGERSTDSTAAALSKRTRIVSLSSTCTNREQTGNDSSSSGGNLTQWHCSQCTLLNSAGTVHCSVCNYPAPTRLQPKSHQVSAGAGATTTAAAAGAASTATFRQQSPRRVSTRSRAVAGVERVGRTAGGNTGGREVIELLDSDSD